MAADPSDGAPFACSGRERTTIHDCNFKETYRSRMRATRGISVVLLKSRNKSLKDLAGHIALRLGRICDELGISDLIEIYDDSIHATIIGLEGRRQGDDRIVHDNLLARMAGRADHHPVPAMDLQGLVDFFRHVRLPLHIRIGGVTPDDVNPYDPDRRPFERTFAIRDDGLLVMIGWPVVPDRGGFAPVPMLLGLRKYLERFHVVHKYHRQTSAQDNDLFIVLGSLNLEQWEKLGTRERCNALNRLDQLRNAMRLYLNEPRFIEADESDFWVVEYLTTTLAKRGFGKRIVDCTEPELRSLYR